MVDAPSRTYESPDRAPEPARMVSCWLCGKSLAVRRSKDGHLFVSCLDCGMQVFVRSTSGEERLNAKCGGQQP